MAVATTHQPASVHPSFDWLRSEHVDSLNVTVEEYRHRKTGAQHFHLAADNDENVFLVALRTVPMDSTGVAHILEHTALCGSERYPVRDPFFMMIRRSLNTFMNAFTSSDWTAYPFASQNRKDFFNLLDVYLDAVFFSRLAELDFLQEGHRLEFADHEDADSPLVYKGVVFNEMKGAMSSPASVLWQTLGKYLFPTNTYHYNSGGDPESIPDLSYAELRAFYATHYHPSNAVFMTYGDIPAIDHHARFEDQALARFDKLDVHIRVADEKRYLAPVRVEESYAVTAEDGDADKAHVVLGWLLGHSADLDRQLEAHLLSGVLLDDSSSPLRHALETTELGAAPSPLCGLEDSNREMTFMCGVENSRAERAQAVEQLVLGVLEKIADQGVDAARMEAVLHQIELSQREIGGDGFPYGLQLVMNCLSSATHGGDPVASLNLDPALARLRERIGDPEYFKSLVRELLLENQHRVLLTLRPDSGLAARREQAEAERLVAIKQTLDEAERAQIIETAEQLAARQQTEDDPEVLPKVGLEDIPPTLKVAAGRAAKAAAAPLTFFDQGTNGLVYQQIIRPLPRLDDDATDLLGVFCNCVAELGVGDRDYLQNQAYQSAVTGGISAALSSRTQIDDLQQLAGHFVLSGKALARKQDTLGELLQETADKVRFDELERIRELIAQDRAQREQSVTGSGHMLAMAAAASGLSPAAAISHRLNGLAGIRNLKRIDSALDSNQEVAALAERFAALNTMLTEAPLQLLAIGEAEHNDEVAATLASLWREWQPHESTSAFAPSIEVSRVQQFWTTNTQVNFCAKAYPTVPYDHADSAPLTVLGVLLRNGFLHRVIREQGGAYGGGASHDSELGAFRFFSYRDPRLQETLDDFDRALDWLQDQDHEPRLVEEAILGVIGAIDKPASPAGEARKSFYNALYGRTPELRQRFRENVLATGLEDLRRVASTYLDPSKASVAVVSSAAALEQHGDLGMEVEPL